MWSSPSLFGIWMHVYWTFFILICTLGSAANKKLINSTGPHGKSLDDQICGPSLLCNQSFFLFFFWMAKRNSIQPRKNNLNGTYKNKKPNWTNPGGRASDDFINGCRVQICWDFYCSFDLSKCNSTITIHGNIYIYIYVLINICPFAAQNQISWRGQTPVFFY